jgi:hypothetical protein
MVTLNLITTGIFKIGKLNKYKYNKIKVASI